MRLNIKLHPNSSNEKIVNVCDEKYEVWIKEKSINNKANIYLEKYLKRFFKRKVKIVSGFNSRNKILEVF